MTVLPGNQPVAAWQARQEAARVRLASLPAPTTKDQCWRFATAKLWADLPGRTEELTEAEALQAVERSQALEETSARLVFHGDKLLHREIRDTRADFLSLQEAWNTIPEIMERHFLSVGAPLGSERFAALHESALRDALILRLPPETRLTQPIEIWRWAAGSAAHFPHLLILAEENSEATVLEHFVSLDHAPATVISMADIVTRPGAAVRHAVAQRLNDASRAVQITSTSAVKQASVTSFILNAGANAVRQENLTALLGEGARSVMLSASLMDGSRELDQRTLQRHDSPGAYSDLLYKNVMDDTARAIFSGLIQVKEGAHHTDAYQKCRNLMLSDTSEANAMPGLEINADQVKCSHGATSGAVEAEELFYFESRGIPVADARNLIAAGFAEEAVDKFGDKAVVAWIRSIIESALEA